VFVHGGDDDFGLEKDFILEVEAWTTFLEVIGQEFVDHDYLISLGFKGA
jgi:hypothetical protein